MKGIFQVPTVLKIKLDASDFEKERNRVVDGVKELQAKTAQTNSVSVKVDPSDLSDVSDVSDKVRNIEGTHEIRFSGKTDLDKTLSIPTENLINKTKRGLKNVWQEMTKMEGAAGKTVESLFAGGGAVGIFALALNNLAKLATGVFLRIKQNWLDMMDGMKLGISEIVLSSQRKAREFSADNAVISNLQNMNAVEKLSAMQKVEVAEAVDYLSRRYKNLGLEIDSETGKVKDLDKAMLAIEKRQLSVKISDAGLQIQRYQEIIKTATEATRKQGAGTEYWQNIKQQYGFGNATEAVTAMNDASEKLRELQLQRQEDEAKLKELDLLYSARRQARLKDKDSSLSIRKQEFSQRMQEDSYHRMSLQEKISYAETQVSDTNDLLEKLKNEYNRYARGDEIQDQEHRFRELKRIDTEILAGKVKIYDWEQKITQLKKEQKDATETQKQIEASQKAGLREYFVGQVRQVGPVGHVEQALNDARAAKGADLTGAESEAVRKIAKLTYSMNNRLENNPGNLSIKTNALTARGGFQGGGVAPDLERYNRITAENSRQTLARMRTLESNVAKILKCFEM